MSTDPKAKNTEHNWNVSKDDSAPVKKAKKKKKPQKKPGESKAGKLFGRIAAFLENDKTIRAFGLFMILLSLYLVLAFSSFVFTGKEDFDQIQNNNIFDFLFDSDIEVENWLGNLGAAVSHFFIFKGFGFASIAFPFIFFLIGFKMLFKFSLLPLKKSIKHSFLLLIWLSLALGLIFYDSTFKFLYGQFGFQVNTWLFRVIGEIGTSFVLILSLFIYIIYSFEVSFDYLVKMFSLKNAESEDTEIDAKDEFLSEISGIKEEPVSSDIDNLEVEEQIEVVENAEGAIELETEGEVENETANEDDGSIQLDTEVPQAEVAETEGDVELSVEEVEQEETLSDKEISKNLEDFGPYDPTLDLPKYQVPTADLLLEHGSDKIGVDKDELEANKNRIVSSLENYNIKIQSIKATIGPTVTLYEIVPEAGIRISKIKNLEDDIALSLAALGIRIIAPIPGKGTIGIEVPNKNPEVVSMKTVLASSKFQEAKMDLPIVLGKTISNESYVVDLAKMPHILMAGATGQGKSVGLNVVLTSLLYKKHPSQLKFVMVDPKKVELTLYNKIERHFLAKLPDTEDPIITDNQKVIHTLNSLCVEMDQRYELLKEAYVRNIKEYNDKFVKRKLNPEKGHRYLPYIVLVVDEFADLIMTAGKEVEQPIARLAQLARAIGIHLIIATQRPSTNIITGSIKANFPARIAFRVTSGIDSRTILDSGGAEQLIGRGDMLISTGSDLIRIQCAFVDTPEVENITEFIGNQQGYPDAFLLPEYVDESGGSQSGDVAADERDALFNDAAQLVVQHQQGSASLLQRRLKLGYNRAGRIIDQLEAAGIIGPFEGSKARKVLVQDEQSLNLLLNPETNESNETEADV